MLCGLPFVSPNRIDPFLIPLTDKLEFLRQMVPG